MRYKCDVCHVKKFYRKSLRKHLKDPNCKVVEINCVPCDTNETHEFCPRVRQKGLKQRQMKVKKEEPVKQETEMDSLKDPLISNDNKIKKKRIYKKLPKPRRQEKGSLQCEYESCQFSTSSKSDFTVHIENSHLKLLKYYCNLCDFKSYFSTRTKKHQMENHSESDDCKVMKIGCSLCDLKVDHQKHISQDKKVPVGKLKDGSLKCDYETCSYSTNQNYDLRVHIEKIHLNLFRFGCNQCEYKNQTRQHMKTHFKSSNHLGKDCRVLKLTCILCEDQADHKDHVYKEEETTDKKANIKLKKKYSCEKSDCKFSSNEMYELRKHINSCHNEVMRFACNLCDYKSYHLNNLQRHINGTTHDGDNMERKVLNISCELCEKETEHQSHKYSVLTETLKKMDFHCVECNYKTDKKGSLDKHLNIIHSNIMKYSCSLCDYRSPVRKVIKDHIEGKNHIGLEPKIITIHCTLCKENSDHKIHVYVPGTGKTFQMARVENIQCSECDKLFPSQKQKLIHYISEHKDCKNLFNCEKCDYSTNYLSNLKIHDDSSHGEVCSIKCEHCSRKFSWKTAYLTHMRVKHGQFQRNSKHRKAREIKLEN